MTVTLVHTDKIVAGLAAVALHTEKGTVHSTAILNVVRVSDVRAVATQRYTIGGYTFEQPTDGTVQDDENFVLVPRAAIEWLAKQTVKTLGCYGATLKFSEDSIEISEGEELLAVYRFPVKRGNFPPVWRLVEGATIAKDATVTSLNPTYLELFTKAAKVLAKTHDSAKTGTLLRFTPTGDNPLKPGPVLITCGEQFTGLLQPSYLLR